MPERRTVALVTLGCARNEVDSEELAGRLEADGWDLVEDAADADVAVLVNTCGFVDAAKKDSVDALLEANDLKGHGRTQAVVAVGCMAERYGEELAEALPEADARARVRRLRQHSGPPADRPERGHPRRPHPARPAPAAADLVRRAAGPRPARGPGTGPSTVRRARSPAACAPAPPLDGAPVAR